MLHGVVYLLIFCMQKKCVIKMNRKQNSLMRFSRTERLAQLSEQEIVIEKKKREIQAKLEAQKKKETEEAFKKLEFSKETNNMKPGFSKKSWNGSEGKKNSSREKPVEKLKESLTNAFSNDGTFLDQFKKLSQTGLSSTCDAQSLTTEKREGDIKDFSDSNKGSLSMRETNRKRENENDRDNSESLKKSKKAFRDNTQLFLIKNSASSEVQLQAPGAFQFPQHEGVSNVDSSKSVVSVLPIQISQTQGAGNHPEFYSNNMSLNSEQSNRSNTVQLKPPVQLPASCEGFNSKKFPANEPSSNSLSLTLTQPPVTSQNDPRPSPILSTSVQASEIPRVRSESISMTLKINTVKKLEAIPNPLDIDQALSPDSVKKNHLSFFEKESSKSSFLNASQNCRSTPIVENVSSHDKESSRISSAFCNDDDNDDDDDDDDGEDEDKYKNKDGIQLNNKVQHWASLVARCGDEFEDSLRSRNENDPDLRFLSNKNSEEYLSYRRLVLNYRMRLKCSKEGPSENSRKLNFPKTYSERSTENIFPSNKELHKTKTSIEDPYIIKDYLGSKKMFSEGQEEIKKTSEIHKNQISSDECNSLLESTFKDQCFFNSQKESHSKETSSQVLKEENNVEGCGQLKTEERRKRKRKSRWGDAEPTTSIPGIEANMDLQPHGKLPAPKSTLLSQLTRSDPGLIQYARQTFGSTNLSEEDWKKAEDHYKINLLYQDMIKKRAEVEKLERQGKFKYEYDSDEDTEGGTWEHKLRQQEMQATQLWAEELTRQAAGKHHIGDFLPPEELERFMEKYNAVKEGREPDLSDYKEYKLKEDNVGYRLLQKMGWNEGQGLGQDGSGITNPVNKGATRHENQGLGVERPDGLEPGDDEYDAYRKRMMLAYRFRPNPLNNPRRPYY